MYPQIMPLAELTEPENHKETPQNLELQEKLARSVSSRLPIIFPMPGKKTPRISIPKIRKRKSHRQES